MMAASKTGGAGAVTPPLRPNASLHFPRLYAIPLALLIISLVLIAGFVLHHDYQNTIKREEVLLTRAAVDTQQSIQGWVTLTGQHAEVLSRFPAVAEAVQGGSPTAIAHAALVLENSREPFGYEAIYLADSNGHEVTRTSGAAPLPQPVEAELSKSNPAGPVSCIGAGRNPGFPQVAFLRPIRRTDGGHAKLGWLIILTRPEAMANLVEPEGPGTTVRPLLFSQDGTGRIVFFSRMMHLHGNLDWRDELAEAAMRGESKFVTRLTPDGLKQYAVSATIPQLGWGLIVREWRNTVLAVFYRMIIWATLVLLAISALLVSLAYALWRHQQVAALRAEIEQKEKFDLDLRASEERFNTAFRCAPVGMSISRISDGRFVEVNETFERMAGQPREEILGRTSKDLDFWSDPGDRDRLLQSVTEKVPVHGFRARGHGRGGEEIEAEISADIVEIRGEKCLLLILQDITPQLLLQESLRQAQKMEALGLLAGAVAHDFNNLLMAISAQAELLQLSTDPVIIQKRTQQILNATASAAQMTRKLLALGQKQELAASSLEAGEFLVHIAELLGDLLPANIELEHKLSPLPCWIRCDRLQLEQMFINLVLNSRDAMPGGGKIVLASSQVTIGPSEVLLHGGVPGGTYALLTVADTGCGIPAANLERVFEPFFTTKGRHGSGLGLSMVYSIVHHANGHLRLRSTVAAGTTFFIYFPITETPPQADSAAAQRIPEIAERPRLGTVLVVDDEELICQGVAQFLREEGLDVLAFADPTAALSAGTALGGKLGLLVTDVVMPKLNGADLATALVAGRPGLPVIFTSGYAARAGAAPTLEHSIFLQKPFNRKSLLAAVWQALSP
jgi:PAS domain S-box-containing protein